MRKTATETTTTPAQGSLEKLWDPDAAKAAPVAFQPRSGAVLSDCGTYRYSLERQWNPDAPTVLWVMLNPSTADGFVDDPTIRKVRLLSDRNGFGEAIVVNLFAFRATDPKQLQAEWNPGHVGSNEPIVGRDNDAHIRAAANRAKRVVIAWGAKIPRIMMPERIEAVRELLKKEGHLALWALKLTVKGEPHHPLYQPNETRFVLELELRRKAMFESEM